MPEEVSQPSVAIEDPPHPRLMFVVTEDWYFCSHRLHLARKASEAGYEVSVVTRPGTELEQIEAVGIRLLPLEMDRSGMNPFRELACVMRLARLLRTEQPDIVHLVALKPVLLGNLAARISGVRRRVSAVAGMGFLFTGDGRGGWLMPAVRRLLAWALRGSRVIVQNPDDMHLLRDSFGVPDEDLQLIRGVGVDIERFRPGQAPGGVPVVMLPSRLLWDKGVGEFVEAARRLQENGVEARFVLVGAPDPDNPASIPPTSLDQWQDEGVIEWWGHQHDMAAIYPQAHIVCLPSYREGLPKALIEAAACGLPIVTTDVPGCREVVKDGVNGLLVPPREPGALADALERLIRDPELRRRMGEAGRRRAEEEFAEEKINQQTLAIYEELLGMGGKGGSVSATHRAEDS